MEDSFWVWVSEAVRGNYLDTLNMPENIAGVGPTLVPHRYPMWGTWGTYMFCAPFWGTYFN